MSILSEPYGQMPDGSFVNQFTLTGSGGLSATVITYGATLTRLSYGGRDVVLGYDSLEDYRTRGGYLGATVGRYANRIAGGRFVLNGTSYRVGCNEKGVTHLHGGPLGFDTRVWAPVIEQIEPVPTLKLYLLSEDGEMGYPGRMTVAVTYAVLPDDTLEITYHAESDKDTVLNLTNHSYFNLGGYDGGDVLDTELTLYADAITPVDSLLIPTGELLPVEGTPFDFRQGKPLGRDMGADHPQLFGRLYDHNFVLGPAGEMKHAAGAYSPRSGIRMDCWTDQPGVQLYTSPGLDLPGKNGCVPGPYPSFCLETQHFPDSPNHENFPSTVLGAGESFDSVTRYVFSMG